LADVIIKAYIQFIISIVTVRYSVFSAIVISLVV